MDSRTTVNISSIQTASPIEVGAMMFGLSLDIYNTTLSIEAFANNVLRYFNIQTQGDYDILETMLQKARPYSSPRYGAFMNNLRDQFKKTTTRDDKGNHNLSSNTKNENIYKNMKNDHVKLASLLEDINFQSEADQKVKLTSSQKKKLLLMIGNFNEYGKELKTDGRLVEIAKRLQEIAKSAEAFAMDDAKEWFDKVTVARNMKDLKKLADDFGKASEECNTLQQRLAALYEDVGHILSRYYEINDVEEEAREQNIQNPNTISPAQPRQKKVAPEVSAASRVALPS